MSEEKIIHINIEDEIKQSYLNYAMSVIVSRALPDARDGLKPVHRRILYTMFESGMHHNTPTKKSANVVGSALGRYHPHGQVSVYDALVRLAQNFSLRYPLVFGQGNFGSLDRDPPAADRYTETRLEQIAEEMLGDIKKNTVDFVLNYDESRKEPSVLPAALPCLLLNGSTGIAVGFTTEIPPHNLNEVADAIAAYIDNSEITIDELLTFIKGPDFPTGAAIHGISGLRQAYHSGKGIITIQSHHIIEERENGDRIIFTDLPFAKSKAEIIKRLADKVNSGEIPTIRNIADESNKEGVRIVVDLKKDTNTQITLQKIFSHTDFRMRYSINMIALVKGRPRQLSLKEILSVYVEHRKSVASRKAQFELKEAEDRAHIVRGLLIAIKDVDEVIRLIKASETAKIAHEKLMKHYNLSTIQAQAILDMRLQSLTGLELEKLEKELAALEKTIASLKDFLSSPQKILASIKENILRIKNKYGDARKTEILLAETDAVNEEDLIEKEAMLITLSSAGYIKRTPLSEFGVQRRGGKGKFGINLGKNDYPKQMFVGQTHDPILFITSRGRSFIIKIYKISVGSRTARGYSVKGLLPLETNEHISSIVCIPQNLPEDTSLFLATKKGKVKKIEWNKISHSATTKRGVRVISLSEEDEVIEGSLIQKNQDIFLFSSEGKALRFPSPAVRIMGRTAAGCGGMKFKQKNTVIVNAFVAEKNEKILLMTQLGYGKLLDAQSITPHGRNTMGVKAINILENDALVNGFVVEQTDSVSAISSQGKIIRFSIKACPSMGRNARGVKLFEIDNEDRVITTSRIQEEIEDKKQ